MLESTYQAKLIKRLTQTFPGSVILKNDTDYQQGVPDLLFLYGSFWAMLEVKTSANAVQQPNQGYFVEVFNDMSWAAFVYPENEEEIIHALKQTLGFGG